jgi:glucose-1-phosphate adenylyltransferase
MDYARMVEFHRESGADVTIAVIEVPLRQASRFGVLETDSRARVTGFEEKPVSPKPAAFRSNVALCSMGIYVFDMDVLRRACVEDAERATSHDFGKDILPKLVQSHKVYAYNFSNDTPYEDYWRDVGTLDSYWDAHMDLLRTPPSIDLYDPNWPIRTLAPMVAPTRFACPGDRDVQNTLIDSLVSPGCNLGGATVERSILSPQVTIDAGAHVEESVLLHNTRIGRGTRIRRAIVEKRVVVPPGVEIGYDPEEDARRFKVTPEGIVVIDQNTSLNCLETHVEYV